MGKCDESGRFSPESLLLNIYQQPMTFVSFKDREKWESVLEKGRRRRESEMGKAVQEIVRWGEETEVKDSGEGKGTGKERAEIKRGPIVREEREWMTETKRENYCTY